MRAHRVDLRFGVFDKSSPLLRNLDKKGFDMRAHKGGIGAHGSGA